MLPSRSPPARAGAPCQPSTHPAPTAVPGVKPGRVPLEERRLSVPWRNTNTHQRSPETRAQSPGRERRRGNGGGSRGHGSQARETGSAGSQQPPSPWLHPQPQQTALAPPLHLGSHRVHRPRPRQSRAVPMSLGATQGPMAAAMAANPFSRGANTSKGEFGPPNPLQQGEGGRRSKDTGAHGTSIPVGSRAWPAGHGQGCSGSAPPAAQPRKASLRAFPSLGN